jgi:hypothetical protein
MRSPALALSLEEAVDLAVESCTRGELHHFLFYFAVLLRFMDDFGYSHFRSLEWLCRLLPSVLTIRPRNNGEFESQSLAVASNPRLGREPHRYGPSRSKCRPPALPLSAESPYLRGRSRPLLQAL